MKHLNFKSSLLFLLLTTALTALLFLVHGYFTTLFHPMWTSDLSTQEWIFWEEIVQDYWFLLLPVIYLPTINQYNTELSFVKLCAVNVLAFTLCSNFLNFPISWVSIVLFVIDEKKFLQQCSFVQKKLITLLMVILTFWNQISFWDLVHPGTFSQAETKPIFQFFALCWLGLCASIGFVKKESFKLINQHKNLNSPPKDEHIIELFKQSDNTELIVTLDNEVEVIVWNIAWGYDQMDEYAHITTNISPDKEGSTIDTFYTSEIGTIVKSGQVIYSKT